MTWLGFSRVLCTPSRQLISFSPMSLRTCALLLAIPLALPTFAAPPATEEAEKKEKEQLINELFVGENVYRQDKGEFVLVLAPSFAKANDAKEFEFEPELKYGLTDNIQLSIELPYTIVNPDSGSQHQGVGDLRL